MDTNPLERLYGVFAKSETYLNLLYLLLAFPLGLAYFIFLVTGLSLGVGLLILWVGFLILAGVLALCWPLTLFERQQAISLLRVDMPPLSHPAQQPTGSVFQQIKNHLSNPVTWKGIAFLFLKFPIGIACFVVTITLISLSFGLVFAPLVYPWANINFGSYTIHSMPAALVACLVGLVLAPLSLHLFNWIATWLGLFAKVMLSNPVSKPLSPVPTPQAPVAPTPASPEGF
jgi:hypothetical protein